MYSSATCSTSPTGPPAATSSSTCPRASPRAPRRPCATTSSPPSSPTRFDNALGFIRTAVEGRNSKAAYLHGSFGAGKSHFMAVLHLLLQHDPRRRGRRSWPRAGLRQARLGPGQAVPARAVPHDRRAEHGVGGPRRLRRPRAAGPPRRPLAAASTWPTTSSTTPAHQRELLGDEKFFAADQPGGQAARRTKLGQARHGRWNAASVRGRAARAPPGERRTRGPARRRPGQVPLPRLPGRLGRGKTESYLSLDKGLSVISPPRQGAGLRRPDPVPRRADPLAGHARRRPRVRPTEGQKLAKLVESQTPDRPVPIVSFVARQRDLRDLVGKNAPAPSSSTSPTSCGTGRAGSTRSSWRTATSP